MKMEIQNHLLQIFKLLDLDECLSDTSSTSEMVAQMYIDIFSGVTSDTNKMLSNLIPVNKAEYGQLIILNSISFYSMCEHHFLPFFGFVNICYVPNQSLVGLGDITELVKVLMRRPQLQEKFTSELHELINSKLKPLGCGIQVEARHFCETMRGNEEDSQIFTTYQFSGELLENSLYQSSFLKSITSS